MNQGDILFRSAVNDDENDDEESFDADYPSEEEIMPLSEEEGLEGEESLDEQDNYQ